MLFRSFLCHVPFADHNAMIDPSTPDLACRVLESLGRLGRRLGDPVVNRAVAYVRKSQESDGCWFSRWGVNYIYGTFLAPRGLEAPGESEREAFILRVGEWLLSTQNADGGWGETCACYDKQAFFAATSAHSKTREDLAGVADMCDRRRRSANRFTE